jgi:hypothetical protein
MRGLATERRFLAPSANSKFEIRTTPTKGREHPKAFGVTECSRRKLETERLSGLRFEHSAVSVIRACFGFRVSEFRYSNSFAVRRIFSDFFDRHKTFRL